MTTFKGIRGTAIQSLASDPTNPIEGQIWYNNSTGALKGYLNTGVGAWSSGGNFPTIISAPFGAGTQTAALAVGGSNPSLSPVYQNKTNYYNGTAWTTVPATLNTARTDGASVGTQTAALISGGNQINTITNAESYNGTSWTNVPSMSTARTHVGAAGTQTAALTIGGDANGPGSNTATAAVESWNGSAWTGAPSLNNAAGYNVGNGLQTAAITYGGYNWGTSTTLSVTELYNGTAWTNTTSMPSARYAHAGSGTQTAAISYGGNPNANVALWNGTTWTVGTNMGTPRNDPSKQIGTQAAALTAGGDAGAGSLNLTEAWVYPSIGTKTITVS